MPDDYRIDNHKLIFHPKRVSQWLDAADDWNKLKKVYPIYVEISPSGACNHHCAFCAFDYLGYQKKFLKKSTLRKIIPEMSGLGVKSILCSGEGEPLLNKEIIHITKLIAESGIDPAFASNAVLLRQEFVEQALQHVSWIKASISAGTRQTYAKIQGTIESDFDRVIKNLRYAVKWRNRHHLQCTLGAQILLLPENAHEVEALAKICRDEIGLDYLVVKPYSQHFFSITERYKNFDYKKLVKKELLKEDLNSDTFSLIWRDYTIAKTEKIKPYDICRAIPFFYAHITASGDVYGCSSFIGQQNFCYGNINKQGFQEIWEGEKRRKSYEYIRNHLDCSTCRTNCRMDEINGYLHSLRNPIPHVNFI